MWDAGGPVHLRLVISVEQLQADSDTSRDETRYTTAYTSSYDTVYCNRPLRFSVLAWEEWVFLEMY